MEFSISIPQTFPDPARIQRFLKRAEELPIVGAWCIEQVIGTAPVLESVTTLAYTAAVTKRLRLGIAVLIRLSAVTLKIAICGISTPAKPDRRMRFLNRLWFHRNSFEMREPPIQCHAHLCPEAFHNRKIFPEPCDAGFACKPVRWIVFRAMTQADPDNEPSIRENIER